MTPDRRMRQILAEMTLLPYGAVMNLERSGGGESYGPQGESFPLADYWAGRYAAATPKAKQGVVEAAQKALDAMKKRPEPPPASDPEKARMDRMCGETKGWPAEDAAKAFRVTVACVYKERRKRGLSPFDGTGDQEAEIHRMREDGKTLRQISMLTGIPLTSVHRLLEKA